MFDTQKYEVALIWDETFPGSEEIARIKENIIEGLNREVSLTTLSPEEVTSENLDKMDCLVNLYGPYFPVERWATLFGFLKKGSLVNIGGIPFRKPVALINGKWEIQTETQTYHRRIFIRQVYTIPANRVYSYNVSDEVSILSNFTDIIEADEFYGFNTRYTYKVAIPRDGGSSGPADGQLRPLLYGLDENGRAVASPVLAIDILDGELEGSRIVIGNFRPKSSFWESPKLINFLSKLICFASKRALLFHSMPSLATYYSGEKPSLILRCRSYENDPSKDTAITKIKVEKGDEMIYEESTVLGYLPNQTRQVIQLGIKVEPGIYHIACEFQYNDKTTITWHTGFWGYDEDLLKSGVEITADRDYFEKAGKTCVITGTTYMSHDTHRKFLWIFNPWLWYQDMRMMKECGINMIRTGIWYALRHLVFERGIISEECLRAMDAFLLSAKASDIMVTFTFFAFIPEEWEGINPYLDPRSISAQQDYLSAFAQRYKDVKGIIWDLINEPSVCSREQIWKTRPNYDKFELALWKKWVVQKYKDIKGLWDTWRVTPEEIPSFEAVTLPTPEEFGDVPSERAKMSNKAFDYFLFQHEIFNDWIKSMTTAIRSSGDRHLITVGQDEGGVEERPAVHYHVDLVDHTCIHLWHMNDQALWSCTTTKTTKVPNLLQEVGTTYIEDRDTIERRTPEENASLLERKIITAMAGLCSGFIQWPWNSNTMMNSDGEASIGLWRDDGTYKPELNVIEGLSKFFRTAEQYMENRRIEDTCLVISYSHRYGELPRAPKIMTPEPSMIAMRVLSYYNRATLYCIDEYHVEEIGNPKLVILPSIQAFDETSWERLMEKVEEGATLLVTGAINFDPYLRPIPRTLSFGIDTEEQYRYVTREEYMILDGEKYRLTFPDWKMIYFKKLVLKDVNEDEQGQVFVERYGKGKIIYCTLPVEGSSEIEPIRELYAFAMRMAGIQPIFQVDPDDPSVLIRPIVYSQAILYPIVNESSISKKVTIVDMNSNAKFKLLLKRQSGALLMIDYDGNIIARYGDMIAS